MLDGTAIAGSKSCKFNISQNFIKACSPTSGRVREKIPTDYDWSVSVDCLLPSSTLSVSLTDKLIGGTKCLLFFTDGSGQNRAGYVYVKSCDESGSVGSLATFSASFESSGPLYKYQTPVPAYFQEGDGIGIDVSNNTFSFNGTGNTYGIGFTVPNTSTAIIKARSEWAIVDLPFDDNLKTAVGHSDTQPFEGHEVAVGSASATLTLLAGTYTILQDYRVLQPFSVTILTE